MPKVYIGDVIMMTKRKSAATDTLDMKKKYVLIAIRIMEEEGIDGLNIRRVADEAGCTCAVLYRHFDNKQDLMMVAAVKFLQPYIKYLRHEFDRVDKQDANLIQADLSNWKAFIDNAFQNKVYYDLFFNGEKYESMSEYILEYYRLFPSEMISLDGFTGNIVLSTDLNTRAFISLRRSANLGLISMKNSYTLARISTAVFFGMLSQCPTSPDNDAAIKAAANECFELITELYSIYVNPGVDVTAEV